MKSLASMFPVVGLAVVFLGSAVTLASAQALTQRSTTQPQTVMGGPVADIAAIDQVWAGHAIGFDLVVSKSRLYVGYYDAARQLTVASRPLTSKAGWVYHKLPSWVGWDSHNYVALAIDADEQLHVAANMHVDPLNYYRTETPGDVRTLKRVERMVDPSLESKATYPVFLQDGAGRLVFKYRTGGSGNGNEIYNVYDPKARLWSRLLATPLTDGEGQRNAYFVGPVLGPDKAFHIAWVWRDSPDASTNHDLSYAKSTDLVHWTKSDGTPLALPITLARAEIVDAVPTGGGMINNNTVLGFDGEGRPIITYHKFDAAGDTQIHVARREATGWRVVQISRWTGFRWDFKGTGSLSSLVFVSGARMGPDGKLHVPVVRLGRSREFVLDPATLATLEERDVLALKDQLAVQMPVPAGMALNVIEAQVAAEGPRYALAWASMPPNRDAPTSDVPPPSTLKLIELAKAATPQSAGTKP